MAQLDPPAGYTCKLCGRGVADGATFRPIKERPGTFISRCRDCEAARMRELRARDRQAATGSAARAPRAALYRSNAARDRARADTIDDPIYRRRLLRAARDWETLAADAEAGRRL